ncbi:MAG: arginine--tRNA ligase, partial [Gemmatimonadota bacterium]
MAQEEIRRALEAVLEDLGQSADDIHLERPRDPSHGDLSTNVAMTLAGRLKRPPRQIAEDIAQRLDLGAAGVESVDVAGPGFLNFRLTSGAVASVLDDILRGDEAYGKSEAGQ